MLRVCPKCQSNLSSHENYFCANCGEELPETYIQRDLSFKAITTISAPDGDTSSWAQLMTFMKKRLSPLPVSVLVMGVISFLIFTYGLYLTLRKEPVIQPYPQPRVEKTIVEDTTSKPEEDKTYELIEPEFAEYVPYDTDVFIETNDISLVKDIFLTMDPYYAEFLDQILPLVKTHAAIYLSDLSTTPSVSLILEPLTMDEEVEYVDFGRYPWMSTDIYDNYLLVSSKISYVVKSQSAKEGLIKNLKHHPKYTIMSSAEDIKGSTVVLFMNSVGEEYIKMLISNLSPEKYSDLQRKMADNPGNYVVM